MKNIEKLGCVAFIALNVGMAIATVGQTPKHPNEPFGWSIVWLVFVFLATPSALAYWAGRHDGEDS